MRVSLAENRAPVSWAARAATVLAVAALVAFWALAARAEAADEMIRAEAADEMIRTEAADEMTVLWFERRPLYFMRNGRPDGGLLELTDRVLRRSGMRPVYIQMPHRRVLRTLRDAGHENLVGVGWYRTAEREVWLRYSRPIARETAMGILVRRDDRERFLAFASFADLLASPALTPGKIDGYSYGAEVDELFKERTAEVMRANKDAQLFALLAANRCDYMLAPEPTLTELVRDAGMRPEDFAFVHYADMPQGARRYLVFSRETSQETVDRVDAAILDLVGDLR